MLFKRNSIQDAKTRSGSLLVNGDFINGRRLSSSNQGVMHLTITATQGMERQVFIRFILSLQHGVFLYSQDQPAEMQRYAPRIEFNQRDIFECKRKLTEIGAHFIHTDGARGLKPSWGNKVTLIRQLERHSRLCYISGRLHYQAFMENQILEPCIEQFRIPLNC